MKKYLKRVFAVILIIVSVMIPVVYAQDNLFILNSHNTWRVRNYYQEHSNTLDTVIMGSSEVFTDYSAGLAYEKYGITSYPYAIDASTVAVWKSQLVEIKRTQNPKLIIIEINGVLYQEDERICNEPAFRRYVDNIPFSMNKVATVIDKPFEDDTLSYFFPFIKYHGNIDSIPEVLKEKTYFAKSGFAKLKGMFTYTVVDKSTKIPFLRNKKEELNANAEIMLIDFLNYCKESQFDNLLFVRFPHKHSSEKSVRTYYRKNYAKEIIQSFGYDFWDLDDSVDLIGIDERTDYYNEDHLNVWGMEKFTSYLGELILLESGNKQIDLDKSQIQKWKETVKYTHLFIDYAKELTNKNKNEWLSETDELIGRFSENETQ